MVSYAQLRVPFVQVFSQRFVGRMNVHNQRRPQPNDACP